MRKKLIYSLLLCCVFSAALASEVAVPFPAEIYGGRERLKIWVADHYPELPAAVKYFPYNKGELVVVYHSSGSGVAKLDAYVYACSPSNCSLLAVRRHIRIDHTVSNPIGSDLLVERKEFILRTHDGIIQLRISLR